jgi:autotransporter-associated beta strand protein
MTDQTGYVGVEIHEKPGTPVTVRNLTESPVNLAVGTANTLQPGQNTSNTALALATTQSTLDLGGNTYNLGGQFETVANQVEYSNLSPNYGNLSGTIPAANFHVQGSGNAGTVALSLNSGSPWTQNLASIWGQVPPPSGLSVAFSAPLSGTLLDNSGSSSFVGSMSGSVTYFDNDQETISANLSVTAGSLTGSGTIVASGQSQLVPANLWATAASGSWSVTSNWIGGVPNAVGAEAGFIAPSTAPVTVTLDTPVTLGALEFGNSASGSTGYVVNAASGSNTMTLSNSGFGATIIVDNGAHVVNAPVILADDLTVASGGTSSWTFVFGTAASITQSDSGGYSVTMDGPGGTLILNGSNSYTGPTMIYAGTLQAIDGFSLPSTSNLVFGGNLYDTGYGAVFQSSGTFSRSLGTGPGQVQWTGDGGFAAIGGPLTVSMSPGVPLVWSSVNNSNGTPGFLGDLSVLTFGSATANNQVNFTDSIDLNGPNENGGNRQIDVAAGAGGDSAEISGNIIDSWGGGGVTKTGAGMLILTGSNTYLGSTVISGGTLQFGDGRAGHDPSMATSGITNNSVVVYNVGIAQTAAYEISGSGSLIKSGNGSLTITNTNTFGGGDSNGDIFGIVSIHQGTIQVPAGGILTNNTSEIDVGDTAGLTGALIMTGGSAWTPWGTAGKSGVNVGINGGTGVILLSGSSLLDASCTANSSGGTAGSFSNAVSIGLPSSTGSVTVGGTSTLKAVGGSPASNGSDIIVGQGGTGSLTVQDSGQVTAANFYLGSNPAFYATSGGTGSLYLNGGTLSVPSIQNNSGTTGNIYFNGGTLQATASSSNFINANGTFNAYVESGGAVIDSNGNNISVGVPLQHYPGGPAVDDGLTKVGAGTLVLTGINTYTGRTNVVDGTLVLTNNEAIADGTNLTVGAGGTFVFDPSAAGAAVTNSSLVASVPEPGTLAMLIAGAALLAMFRKRR